MQQMLRKSKFLVAALITFGFVAGTVTLRADDWDEKRCEKNIHKAQDKLDKAIHKHGEHSPQADQKRHDLEEVRSHCHHDDHDHDHDQH